MNLDSFNEADVREEILAPLIRRLGYRSGSEHHVLREQPLRYNRISLGRKVPAKDPIVRGKADYILIAGGRIRWVLEAKSPGSSISIDEIEQAWSYANHPEVRAIYFVICNGKRLVVFQTAAGPDQPPLLDTSIEDLEAPVSFATLQNLLSPEAILRSHCQVTAPLGVPLGPGLGSLIRINNGWIQYETSTADIAALLQMRIPIVGGGIERSPNNGMVASLEVFAPIGSTQDLLSQLGLTNLELTSTDTSLSTSPSAPTLFSCQQSAIIPAGSVLTDPISWRNVEVAAPFQLRIDVQARGILAGATFAGEITNVGHMGDVYLMTSRGRFSVALS